MIKKGVLLAILFCILLVPVALSGWVDPPEPPNPSFQYMSATVSKTIDVKGGTTPFTPDTLVHSVTALNMGTGDSVVVEIRDINDNKITEFTLTYDSQTGKYTGNWQVSSSIREGGRTYKSYFYIKHPLPSTCQTNPHDEDCDDSAGCIGSTHQSCSGYPSYFKYAWQTVLWQTGWWASDPLHTADDHSWENVYFFNDFVERNAVDGWCIFSTDDCPAGFTKITATKYYHFLYATTGTPGQGGGSTSHTHGGNFVHTHVFHIPVNDDPANAGRCDGGGTPYTINHHNHMLYGRIEHSCGTLSNSGNSPLHYAGMLLCCRGK